MIVAVIYYIHQICLKLLVNSFILTYDIIENKFVHAISIIYLDLNSRTSSEAQQHRDVNRKKKTCKVNESICTIKLVCSNGGETGLGTVSL